MTIISSTVIKNLVLTLIVLKLSSPSHAHFLKTCNIHQIYNIGDSISDTGNLVREIGLATFCARPPYGESFFKKPTGRCSNGLLMIDFIDCIEKVQNALFMFGTIGGNDYNYALFEGKSMKKLRSMVPQVVNAITLGIRKVIAYGGTRVVVPGNFPIGCLPVHKTGLLTNVSAAAYDENQCLKKLNEFAKYHNQQLQQAIHDLQKQNPNIKIVYADYYNAYQFLLTYAKSHGFDTKSACCGIGGEYNYNMTRMCGYEGVRVCPDPDRYVSWDGVHMTQQGYKIMAGWLLRDIFNKLDCHF